MKMLRFAVLACAWVDNSSYLSVVGVVRSRRRHSRFRDQASGLLIALSGYRAREVRASPWFRRVSTIMCGSSMRDEKQEQ